MNTPSPTDPKDSKRFYSYTWPYNHRANLQTSLNHYLVDYLNLLQCNTSKTYPAPGYE